MTNFALSDQKFERIAIRQGYLEYDEIDQCRSLKETDGPLKGKPISEIALHEEMISQEHWDAICEFAQNKKLNFRGYEVKSILGEGGLGVVYLAEQLTMKRYVALKVLYAKWVKDEEFRKRFLLEARIVGKLSHTNLIQVFDIGFDKGRYFFSMEYVAGRTVDAMIKRDGAIELPQAIDISIQVLEALNYIWEKKLVHRDIKPGNIIVTSKGIAKLGDFGFVKSNVEDKLGSDDFVLGTPDYMSPEQALGREDLDYRSDIYSLGSTLYHMITSTVPFQGSESMVIRQHIKSSLPSPCAIISTIPDGMCFILEKMMAKKPEDRYDNYEELKRDLLLVKKGCDPKVERLESGKTTIARLDDANSPWGRLYQLEISSKKMKQREIIYQILIALTTTLFIIALLAR